MEDCFLLDHDTKQFPIKNVAPLVVFQLSTLPAQSTSVNAFRVNYCPFRYHRPYSMVPFRYLKILFTVVIGLHVFPWEMNGI